MTPAQKHLVQISFEQVKPIADTTATLFYGCLFNLNPRLETLFTGDLHEQGRKLMHIIGLAMKGLNRLDELVPLLRQMGARHAGHGVKECDYETVGDALLWALELGLGDEFTPTVKEAWSAVYELLAETMKAGAREALIVTAAPVSNEATTSTGGDRNGWRGYFPAAANKPSKKRETEMQTQDTYEKFTGRFAATIVTLVMLFGLLFLSSVATSAAVITVTGTNDTIAVDGVITLREAITAANTNQPSGDAPGGDPGLDVIKFNIAGSGLQTIALTSALPPITEPITIDGYSQKPCASNPAPCSQPNTLSVGSDAVLLIELNGAAAGGGASGLFLNAGNSTVTGLVINRFGGKGIYISANGNNLIAGNFIGTNAGGTAALPSPNNIQGILITTANNVIGGTLPADRNVVSGNGINGPGGTGVWIDGAGATGNKVIGNYIGTSASGMVGVPNFNTGVVLNNTKLNIIGGVTAVERNLISSNGKGISISGTASNNQIQGNYVGPKADRTGGLGGGTGIVFSGTASNNTIGGAQAGAGNVIAFNSGPGVHVSALNVNNAISGNAIFGNDPLTNYLGIDLFSGGYGVTLNDDNTGDADTGANNLQNFPVITSALVNGATTTIQGTLDSAFSTTFRIELFSNNACDASGFGEGQNYLGFANLTTDGSGKGGFIFTVPTASVIGGFFTATATDPNGNTSEFSACGSGGVATPGTLQLSTNQVQTSENAGSVGISVTRTNGSTGTVTVHYATVDGTAKAPSDYTATSGTVTFNDGETVKPITIPVNDDSTPEGAEYFSLTLTSPTGGAVLGNTSSAKFFIQDNELPALSINDVNVSEGDQGSIKLTFTVTLSDPVGQVLVDYATIAGGTASAGSDYKTASGTLAFNAGETVKHIDVFVNGDTLYEPDETLLVKLSSPQSATIAKAQGVGTIVNDDPLPPAGSLQFSGASFNSKEDGGQATIVLTRTGGSYGAVSVQYATVVGGTATPGSDYAAVTGTLTWADGDTTDKTFTIAITDDSLNEPNESVNLVLNNPAGAQLGAPSTAVLNITDNDAQPGLSVSDVSLVEGNSGPTDFVFNVTLSTASGQTVTVDYSTSDGGASTASDYQPLSGTLTFNPGETSKSIKVQVNGDTTIEPDKTFFVNLSNPGSAALSKAQGTGTIINDDAPAAPTLGFSQANYIVPEQLGVMTLTVTRSGDTSAPASVDYTTSDVSATQKSDYEITAGTLNFAPGEASKTVQVLLNQDMYLEGNESFNVLLSNPSGASLGQASAQVTITDDLPESATNAIDDAQSFVYMHYHDFLNREPDQSGLQFWTNGITACGQDAACLASARVNVSAAYFLSIEFQQTGFLLHLMQKESFGGLPKYAAFMRDLQEVSRGVVVNSPGWEQKLANNQQQFAEKWVNRPEFKALYDGLSNDAYVNALYAHAGIAAPQSEREALVSGLDAATENRAKVLLDLAASAAFRQQEQNSAFVLMQYFGYLRRDPDSGPDSDLSGYYFWLQKLNSFNGDYQKAEMVKAFLDSVEYRGRFGQ